MKNISIAILFLLAIGGTTYGQCNMYDAWAYQRDCFVDPSSGEGPNGLIVHGKVDNPGTMGFEVLTPFGTFGPFDYISNSPYSLFDYMMGIEDEHCAESFTITVRDVEFPSCSIELLYEPEHCCCNIVDLQVDTICSGTGQFELVVDFEITGGDPSNPNFWITLEDDQGNTLFWNTYDLADLPVTIGPFTADCVTPLKVRVDKGGGLDWCLAEWDLGPLCCGANICTISNLIAEPTPCDGMEEYDILLDFVIDNPGGQGFQVYNDYCQCTENFEYADLPILFGPFPGDCMTDIHFEVSDVEFGCIEGIAVEAPCCVVNMNCAIDSMTLDTVCSGVDSFMLIVDFQVSNGSNDGFIIYVNNELDTMDYGDLPLTFGPFPADCSTYYLVYVEDLADPTCAAELDTQAPCCEAPSACLMSDLTLNMSCLEEDSMTVSLDFNIEQGSPDGFELWINDSLYGVLAYADLPYETMPLFVDCSQDYQFRVEDVDDPACYLELAMESPCCEMMLPAFYNVEMDTICHGNGLFSLHVDFDIDHPGAQGWMLQVNTDITGPYMYDSLPYTTGPFDVDCEHAVEITFSDVQYPVAKSIALIDELCCLSSSIHLAEKGQVKYRWITDGTLLIENQGSAPVQLSVYTILGQSLATNQHVNAEQTIHLPVKMGSGGMLVLQITYPTGQETHLILRP
ncbi:MAG: hypothetical protein H6568_11395 [Lewinellaceae bacterium]|nr:hypothetical protein [Saprospiraceae bacterium]MCB9313356.1 hypothetical protein [Lewinellaceae bacterium]